MRCDRKAIKLTDGFERSVIVVCLVASAIPRVKLPAKRIAVFRNDAPQGMDRAATVERQVSTGQSHPPTRWPTPSGATPTSRLLIFSISVVEFLYPGWSRPVSILCPRYDANITFRHRSDHPRKGTKDASILLSKLYFGLSISKHFQPYPKNYRFFILSQKLLFARLIKAISREFCVRLSHRFNSIHLSQFLNKIVRLRSNAACNQVMTRRGVPREIILPIG